MEQMTLVKSRFMDKWWLVNSQKKRVTPKFTSLRYYLDDRSYGNFKFIKCTSIGNILYHSNKDNVLLIGNKKITVMSFHSYTSKLYVAQIEYLGDTRYYLYNEKGDLISTEYSAINYYNEGIFAVKKGENWGFVDEEGNEIIKPKWKTVYNFINGYATVKTHNDELRVINKKGEYVTTAIDCGICWCIAENLLLCVKEKIYYVIKFDGTVVIPPNYTDITLKEDYYCIESGNKKGVAKLDGKVIIPTYYDNIVKNGNYYIVSIGEKYGMFDQEGNKILDCIYPEIIETPDKFVVQEFAKTEIPKTEIKK